SAELTFAEPSGWPDSTPQLDRGSTATGFARAGFRARAALARAFSGPRTLGLSPVARLTLRLMASNPAVAPRRNWPSSPWLRNREALARESGPGVGRGVEPPTWS